MWPLGRYPFNMLLRILAAASALIIPASAQTQLGFEVATVKVSPPREGTARLSSMDTDPALVRYTNLSLRILIAIAYRFNSERIKGPGWIDEQYYDVAAKLPSGTSKDRVPEMMQVLLAERLKVAVHRETKEEQIYFLVAGKDGPKLKKVDDTDAFDPDHVRGDHLPAAIVTGGIIGHAIPIPQLAGMLGNATGREVVDHTGLAGNFNINLRWRPDGVNINPNSPDLFTALQQQLGLKLEPGRGPVELLVVDHAERTPTEN